MFLNIKIFDERLSIVTTDMKDSSIDFLCNTILDGINIYRDKECILIEDNLYTSLLLLNEHYSLIII